MILCNAFVSPGERPATSAEISVGAKRAIFCSRVIAGDVLVDSCFLQETSETASTTAAAEMMMVGFMSIHQC